MKKIRKAIFILPFAGFVRCFLPVTKAMLKELQIVDKPLIKYAVEEVITASIDIQAKNFTGIDILYKTPNTPKNYIDTTTMVFLKFSDLLGIDMFLNVYARKINAVED